MRRSRYKNSLGNRLSGLTLVEVVVAILVLAVGVLGAVALQGTSLRANRTATEIQQLTAAARSELDVWRARLESSVYDGPQDGNCLASEAESCEVRILPCALSGTALTCSPGHLSLPVAQSVTVTVKRGDRDVSLTSVVRVSAP